MVLSSGSPTGSGPGRDFQELLDKDSLSFYCDKSGALDREINTRQLRADTPSASIWGSSSDQWEQDDPLMDIHGPMHLTFLNQTRGLRSSDRQNLLKGSGDPLRMESGAMSSGNHLLQELIIPTGSSHTLHSTPVGEMPVGNNSVKENSEREMKQEMRADSSDGSDGLDDDEDKGGSRSGQRHLSKNLVAERKRRKKLNERLYSLRALVPKITKMDRASILGDAIEYVKELQQQVRDLQNELLESKEDDVQLLHSQPPTENTYPQQVADGKDAPAEGEVVGISKLGHLNGSADSLVPKGSDLTQPMQVEVSKIDSQLLSLRIFCEKRPGVFVKLMQNLEGLGLDVVHANITTFRGIVLNILNAENKDKTMLRPEQVKESLLELSQTRGFCQECLSDESHSVRPELALNGECG